MRKEELEKIADHRPFEPFVVRLVDGRRFRFNSREQFMISRSAIVTLDKEGLLFLINLDMVSTARPVHANGAKKH